MVNSGYDNRLVVSTPLENMKVSWDDYSQYMENNKKWSKPPTSNGYNIGD